MDKILGFAPDADPTVAGVLTAVTNVIPWEQGVKGAPTGATPAGVPALAAACNGAAVVTKLDSTRRIFAGTNTKMYELVAGVWTDVSSGSYTGVTDNRWSIAQFGNSTLVSNGVDTIQRSSGASFSAISGAPKAAIVFTVGTQVMALNINDGTSKPDGWYCSATFDDTNWTTSVATLCAKGQVVSTAGKFTAGGRLGDYAIGYKERAIYIGQFIGAPTVWDWVQAAGGEAGCVGQDAWCDIGGAHFLVGMDNFWIFDGSRPMPVGDDAVRVWFYANSNPQYRYRTQCVNDRQNNVVWIFYCSTTSVTPDKALVYHMKTKMWGHVNVAVEASLNYISPGITIDSLPTYSATIDGLSSFSFDSQFWLYGGRSLSAFNLSHQLQSLTGVSSTSSITTGQTGDDDVVTICNKIRLRFAPSSKPTTANIQTFKTMELGASPTTGSTASLNDGRFDVLDSTRWHSATISFTGDYKLMGISTPLIPNGVV